MTEARLRAYLASREEAKSVQKQKVQWAQGTPTASKPTSRRAPHSDPPRPRSDEARAKALASCKAVWMV